jgi:hypothetical protein
MVSDLLIRSVEKADLPALLQLCPATLKFYQDVGVAENKARFKIRQLLVRDT